MINYNGDLEILVEEEKPEEEQEVIPLEEEKLPEPETIIDSSTQDSIKPPPAKPKIVMKPHPQIQ